MLVYIEVLLANLAQFVSLPAGGIAGLRQQWNDSPLSSPLPQRPQSRAARLGDADSHVAHGTAENLLGPTKEHPRRSQSRLARLAPWATALRSTGCS
jgi:hypothetical protein